MFQFEYNNLDFSHKLDRASSPKDEYWKHMHYFYEMLYFINGDVSYTVDSSSRHLEKGDLIIIHPGKFHFAEVNRNVMYERYVLKFPEEIFDSPFREKITGSATFFHLSDLFVPIISDMDSIVEAFPPDEAAMLLKAHVVELCANLLRNDAPGETSKTNPITSEIISFIDENITKDLSLKIIAEALNYSPSYLANIFKSNMRTPLMQYIRTKKMIFARGMLKHGQNPESTAEMLGFEDYSTFYRSYCKIIGESPSATHKKS